MAEIIYLRGEGGKVWRMGLPLHPDVQKQWDKSLLTRVNEDGTPWTEPEPPKELTPKEKLQADAAALGLDTSGTIAELTSRIEAKLGE